MKTSYAITVGVILFISSIASSTAKCSIPVYLQDKWTMDVSTFIIIRQDAVIYKTKGQPRTRFDCISNDGGLMLLKVRSSPAKAKAGETGVLCLLIDEMADAGYTVQRLNHHKKDENIFKPEYITNDVPLTLPSICHGNGHTRLVFINRAPATPCRFPKIIRGTWNASLGGIRHTDVNKTSLVFTFQDGHTLNLTCEQKRRQKFLLRTDFDKLKPKKDGYFCMRLKNVRRHGGTSFKMLFAKHGTIWDKTVKVIPHKQPLLLIRDCLQTTHVYRKITFTKND